MFEPIKWLFATFVYYPQLNLLYFYNLVTKDLGISIILVAITVNLILWPVMVSSYISGQKMRLLSKKVREIQAKHKQKKGDESAVVMSKMKDMRVEMGELYKKHNIKTGVFFQVLFFQIFFASGVYYVVSEVSKKINGQSVPISGIYENIFSISSFKFSEFGFGGLLNLHKPSTEYLFLPILSFILSYLYGKYSFHWAPNAKLPEFLLPQKNNPGKNGEVDDSPVIDPAQIQKNQEFMIIYLMPFVTFVINASFSAGLNLYFAILSLFNLVRQIIISQYYAGHINKLLAEIAESDPAIKEIIDVEITKELNQSDITNLAGGEIPELVIPAKKVVKTKKKKK